MMKLYDVYPLYKVKPVSAKGITITDDQNREYLDFYGGHAVISIGHSHPHFVQRLTEQLQRIAFYSNAVENPLQEEVANKLGVISGCKNYNLFLCNSGAEANENALKVASFVTGKSRVIAFKNSFHGRTSAAVAATDNPAIKAPLNLQQEVTFIEFEDFDAFHHEISKGDTCAVIIEPIQGVGGLNSPSTEFMKYVEAQCKAHQILLIADEVQSGYGRSGLFFAYQHFGIEPNIISMAKGMGNGFPVGGILLRDDILAKHGQLGTTFGGNHLACTAILSVLDVIESESLISNAQRMGEYFIKKAKELPEITDIKGKGLMLGLSFDFEIKELRQKLIYHERLFTGSSKDKHQLRVLPPLIVTQSEIDLFFEKLKNQLG